MSKKQNNTITTTLPESRLAREFEAPLHSFTEYLSWRAMAMDSTTRRDLDAALESDPELRQAAWAAVEHDLLRWGAALTLKRRSRKPESERAVEREQIAQGKLAARQRLFRQRIDTMDDAITFFKESDLGRIAAAPNGPVYYHFTPTSSATVLVRCEDRVATAFAEHHRIPATVSWSTGGWYNWILAGRAGIAEGLKVRVYGQASVDARALFDPDGMAPLKDVQLQADGRLPAAPPELARLLAIVGGAAGDVDQALLHGV